MKKNSSTVHPFTFPCMGTRLARLIGLAVLALALFIGLALQGSTVISKAPNAAVYFGLPFTTLEFENPLAGTEMVLSHKVLDWRDADYSDGPPPWYDDWSVSAPLPSTGGTPDMIFLLKQDAYAWTTTTVPSTIVSIHLQGDNNDGSGKVLVDGNEVAQLNMNSVPSDTVLIVVNGLSNTTHTIEVYDLGGPQFHDVHILGAAALKESDLKWNQPPLPAHPANVFNGWNQESVENHWPWAADDWACTNAAPVTKIRWWGSFLNWTETTPPALPFGFSVKFWTDVPKGSDSRFPDLSHPGNPLTNILCTNYTWSFVGWDYDVRSNRYEACFLFEQTLPPEEWFYQNPGSGTNIYWISISAMQGTELYPWGWKTRPRDPTSLAPDDAVMFDPSLPWYHRLWTNGSWDLAFELISEYSGSDAKWYQPPDFRMSAQGQPLGMDVNATWIPGSPMTNLLADDFLCTQPGPITNITIWASWYHDEFPSQPPNNVTFTLSIHKDYPMPNPYGYSMPGSNLWVRTFTPGQFTCTQVTNVPEGWFDPPNGPYYPVGDNTCFRYDFAIPAAQAFNQQGGGTIYWLDVQAQPGTGSFRFGWKTSTTNWNDDACHVVAREPFHGVQGLPPKPWNRLTYPSGHPFYPDTVDLAFRLNYREFNVNQVKWSQPPVLFTPPDGYNGWNQLSVEGQQFVADDWVCTNASPVTDIHWWGSFIGWSRPDLPEQIGPTLPVGFQITLWNDVPKGPNALFSHPSDVVRQIYCTNFTREFAGWDFDPRNPLAAPEACFKYSQDLRPEEWFTQDPKQGTNIYWISIAAVYAGGQQVEYPWGWKTRLRDANSLAPDDAVVSAPTSVPPWSPIEYPAGTSWDMAFMLTTREQGNCITVVCSTNIVVTCAPTNGAVVNFQSYATNWCTGGVLPVTCTPPSGSLFPVGITQVCCTNITPPWTNYCCFTVTVLTDTTPPSITCPTNIVANTDPGHCSKSNVTFVVTAVDDCDPAPVIICNPPSGSTFQKGVTTVNCTATDRSGNSNNCSFTVTILDKEPPSVTCASNIVASTDPGLCSKSNVTFTATATDNCAVTNLVCSPPSGSTFAKGVTTVTCTATDSSGNTNSCNFTVTIRDLEPPTVQCPSNIVAAADPGQSSKSNVTWVATATDNCPGVTVACVPPSGSTFPFGTNLVTCTATDASGNSNSCNFTVTICWPKPTTNIVITNIVFTSKFNGWNEPSVLGGTNTVAADDWVCTTTNPVTEIHWWGSYLGWKSNVPPALPNFQIGFWTDVPTNVGAPFSHPGNLLKEVICSSGSYKWQFVGWDVDPRTLEYEACFRFDQVLAANDWFYQTNQPTGTNIYWLSIAAFYPQGPSPQQAWGWKTRPRATNSLAPDDAVRIHNYPVGPYEPIYWPYLTNSWDLAFELVSAQTIPSASKWYQPPDLSTNGIDVQDTWYGPIAPPISYMLADDFLCDSTGYLTNITIWGSWTNDVDWQGGVMFTLAIHADLPPHMPPNQTDYSMPGGMLWMGMFGPGQFNYSLYAANLNEWWLKPPNLVVFPGDHTCFQYDFNIPTNAAFLQTGTSANPKVYWLSVQAQLLAPPAGCAFGWKSCATNWQDNATWVANTNEPYNGSWSKLLHQPTGGTIGMAFRLNSGGSGQQITEVKWSQPPVTNRYLTLEWTWENYVHYQLQATTTLSNAPSLTWSNIGSEVIGPVHQQSDTNTSAPQRFYRVVAPNVVP